MKNNYVFFRGIRLVKSSVFCVDDDQKKFYDPVWKKMIPYSSGQQVKRSIIEDMLDKLGEDYSPMQFWLTASKKDKKLKQNEVTQSCDPTYVDQLFGGWMSTVGKNNKGSTKKRRSPLSISAMTPLHPYLADIYREKNMSFQRDNFYLKITDENKNELSEEEITKFLEENNQKISKNKLIDGKGRVTGIFSFDVVVDLKRAFSVYIEDDMNEVPENIVEKLIEEGWTETNIKNRRSLVLPEAFHEEYANLLSNALVDWRISSNQSRTFDLMPFLFAIVGTRADEISFSVVPEVSEEEEKTVNISVYEQPNTKVYSTLLTKSLPNVNVNPTSTALQDAVEHVKSLILNNKPF